MKKFRDVAKKAALLAGKKLMSRFTRLKASEVYKKGRHDLVTRADMEANTLIIKTIKNRFPDHDFLSEETGLEDNPGQYKWAIDPLDGTINYAMQSPLFCVAISLIFKNDILLSVVFAPYMKDFFYAEKGRGAYLNNKRIHVSKTKQSIESLMLIGRTHHPESHRNFIMIMKKLETNVLNMRRLGSGSLDLVYTAAGRAEGTIFAPPGITLWDAAAGVLMVKEAGGKVSDCNGKKWDYLSKGLVASNGLIHNQLLKVIKL